MQMKKIAFFGGSIPAGVGYPELSESPMLYPNLFKKYNFDIENCSISGANHNEIFLNALNYIVSNSIDTIVIEWNGFFRFRFHPAPNVNFYLSAGGHNQPEPTVHYQPIGNKDINTLLRLLVHLNHEYFSIMTLLDYCKILVSVCKDKNINLVMFNGSIPWKNDLIKIHTPGNLESELSNYTKSLINMDHRDDFEIIDLLAEIKKKFQQINPDVWANDPFLRISDYTIDLAPLDDHPGPKTHQLIAEFIYKNLTERNII